MALKKYRVEYISPEGRLQREIIVGTPEAVVDELSGRGCAVIKIERYFELSFRRKSELVIAFLRNLKSLLESGFSLGRAVDLLSSVERNLLFKRVLCDVKEALDKGGSFFEALSIHPEHFSLPLRMIIKSGEQGGRMIDAVSDALSYAEQEEELKKGLLKQIAAPLVVLSIGVIALFFNTLYTIPKIMNTEFYRQVMAKQTGVALTLIGITTRLVPAVSILFLISGILFMYAYRLYQDQMERLMMRIPVLKEVIFNREVFLIYFTLSRLVRAGIKIEDAIITVRDGIRLKSVRDAFDEVLSLIKSGRPFHDKFPLLDEVEVALISGATSSRRLSEVFELVSKRKLSSYRGMLKKLPALCQAFTYGVLVYLFFLLFFGIIIPYYKSINFMMTHM